MSLLKKPIRVQSSRYQIKIKSVKKGILELPNNEYRAILEVSPLNFELMSIEEQDRVIVIFMGVLGAINFPIEITQRARELDLDEYISNYRIMLENEKDPIYKVQIEGYIKFVKELVETNNILSRQFLVTIPYKSAEKETFESVISRLNNRITIIENGLNSIGVSVKMLSTFDILNLFGSFYNPTMMKRQPITNKTVEMLIENYI